jgi:hypothetical protein
MDGKMKQAIGGIGGAALLAAVAAGPGHADDICDQWGSVVVAGKYIVQNNRYNSPGPQCVRADQSPGFAITQQTKSAPTDGAPVSYPSIYIGCHYDNCSSSSNLPRQIKSITNAATSIKALTYVGGATFDAAYDIWLNPEFIKTGVNKQEIMIWLNKQGPIQPLSDDHHPVDNVKIAGQDWQVWWGSHVISGVRSYVISYVAPSAVSSIRFNVKDFVADLAKRGKITTDYYLTSIQAGFEPWLHGEGLKLEGFQAAVDTQ